MKIGYVEALQPSEWFGERRVSYGTEEPPVKSIGDLWFEVASPYPQPWQWASPGKWLSNCVMVDFVPTSLESNGGSNAANENLFLVKLLSVPGESYLLPGLQIISYSASLRTTVNFAGTLPSPNGAELIVNLWSRTGQKTEIVKFDNIGHPLNSTKPQSGTPDSYILNPYYLEFSVKRLGTDIYVSPLKFVSSLTMNTRYGRPA